VCGGVCYVVGLKLECCVVLCFFAPRHFGLGLLGARAYRECILLLCCACSVKDTDGERIFFFLVVRTRSG
jgi:hypothetical protein